MPGLGLFVSEDLDALVARYVEALAPTDDPLARPTVVVANSAVGQWFEQAVARRTGRPGVDDGVVANVDTIFPSGLLGRLLYGDHRALERWSAPVLALELGAGPGSRLSMGEALARAGVLERLVRLRGDELLDHLAAPGRERERALVERRAAEGDLWPRARFARDGVAHVDQVGSRVSLVGCLVSPLGGLLPEAAAALARVVPTDAYLPVASRALWDADADADALVSRWARSSRAHVGLWREAAGPDAGEWVGATRADAPAVGGVGVRGRVEVHRCVGLARQVEVARDVLTEVLESEDLAPHQVRLVSLDPARVAPLLGLYFSSHDAAGPTLQYEVADPRVARPSARLDALRALLATVESDQTVTDVAALLAQPAVLAGLGLARAAAARVVELAVAGRVSLGLDARAAARRGVFDDVDDAGTWSRFVDRVALASVFEPGREVVGEEVATIGSPQDLEAIATVSVLVATLREATASRGPARPLDQWVGALTRWCRVIDRDDRVRDPSLDRLLGELAVLARAPSAPLSFSDLRDLVEGLAAEAAGGSLSGRGGASLLSLTGAAALPYEVTCVIGLDDDLLSGGARWSGELGEFRPTDPDPRAAVASDAVTFDPVHAALAAVLAEGAAARRGDEAEVALSRVAGEPSPPETTVEASALAGYFRHPQRVFLRDVFAGARLSSTREAAPDVPYLDLGDGLARWSLRDRLLRDAVETGEPARAPRGPDSALGTVAAGFRAPSALALGLEDIDHLAAHVRATLDATQAVREPRSRRPGVARGRHRDVARGPVELYATSLGPVLLRYLASSSVVSHLVSAVVDVAVVTAEFDRAVTGVLLGLEPDNATGEHPPRRPFVTIAWAEEDAVSASRRVLGGLLRLYDRRREGLPLLFSTTSLAIGASGRDADLAAVVGKPDQAWRRGGFDGRPVRGESLEPETRLLVPLDYGDLRRVFDGAVVGAAQELVDVLRALRVGGVGAVPKPLLIEASAGTGKTWALAHLATRFMIEDGVEPGQLLLVTFTRDAARALRGRVREHLVEAIDVMTRAAPVADDWTAALEARWGDDAQRLADLARARHCLAGLDELQASTIHAFTAVNTLGPVGRLGDGERRWRQALAETRARWAATRPGEYALAASGVSTIEAVARALWDAGWRTEGAGAAVRVVPEGDPDPGAVTARAAAARRDIALDVVARFGELLRQARETTFADLVVALAARLEHHDAEHFVARMRSTFRVVMIDEFQDTDPLQWHVFRELFLEAPDTRLVLVGDPKQAIYRFRSASVDTFLEVREYCRARGVAVSTLTRNYRSTPAMVAALTALFRGAVFPYAWAEAREEPAIAYRPAVSSREDDESSPVSGPGGAALVLRAAPYARWVARAVHEEVSDHVVRAHAAGVAYREIAVLCVSNDQCRDVHRHLARRGLPSTSSSEESIFACDAALHLRHLLAALAAPEEVGLTEALRATWFAGPGAEDPGDTRVGQTVARLVVDFEVSGVAAIGRYLRSVDVATRVARRRDGERHLTDLAHLGELMVRECRAAASPALVLSWLEDAASALDTDESATSRRLETESDAVRVLTVHKSKGLEFDVVLAPRLAGTFRKVESEGRYALRRWVDDGRTVVDAGSGVAWGASAECAERVGRTEADSAAEQRRLVYVALTRARRTAVAWVGLPIKLPFSSEFTRLLFDRHEVDARSVVTNRSLAEVRARFVDHGWLAGRDPAVTAAKTDPARVLADVFAPDPGDAVPPAAWHATARQTRSPSGPKRSRVPTR